MKHDLENIIEDTIYPEITSLSREIKQIISNSESISIQDLKSQNVAIVGPPNSGKSSLINFLLGENVSIVSDLEGTTRDAVEKNISHGGNEFKLLDLAGLREINHTEDESMNRHDLIEQEGIKRALQEANKSESLIVVIDCEDVEILSSSEGKVRSQLRKECAHKYGLVLEAVERNFEGSENVIWLLNKSDLLELGPTESGFNLDVEFVLDSSISKEQRVQTANFTSLLKTEDFTF